ncbi:MAG: MBL fold metallo-hydrolase [Acidimicrobiales bacterium]|nr:MBL fold metallo-hydrolase [Acidimicrobiales bacterium]
MYFQQYYLDCLSHASYLIGDQGTGRAVVVDPQRDVARYLADAEAHGLVVERVIETHFHADFLSGHLELAGATGAVISYAEGATADYPIEGLAHGQRLSLGQVTLEIRHTPGHTPESLSVVVYENGDDEVPYGVLTGDTLFIGDVGRPDLLASIGVSADELARQLYHSLHEQLLSLPDATRVFPAHGAGSACGRNLSTETASTIGDQRRTNYALQPMSEDDFVQAITEGQPLAPLYFAFAASRNRQERPTLDEVEAPAALALDRVLELQRQGAVVVDTRDPADFAAGHLLGSVNIGLSGRFAEYAGDVLQPHQPVIVVAENDDGAMEARIRLGRIGFDQVVGRLDDPIRAFVERPDLVARSSRLTTEALAERLGDVPDLQVVDVRNPGEARLGMIPGAALMPLADFVNRFRALDPGRPVAVYCAGGYRSAVAASTLEANGFGDVSDLLGGFDAWATVHLPVIRPDETEVIS